MADKIDTTLLEAHVAEVSRYLAALKQVVEELHSGRWSGNPFGASMLAKLLAAAGLALFSDVSVILKECKCN